jgi:hypothetical protein
LSLVTDILDRLAGIAIIRERMSEMARKVDALADATLDHEKRLIRLEILQGMPAAAADSESGKRLPRR